MEIGDSGFFTGRSVIVTGAGRGIGQAVARRFGQLGARVHCVSKSRNAEETASQIVAAGGSARGHIGMVADSAFAESVVAEADETLVAVVNCAAVLGQWGKFSSVLAESFGEALQTNLIGSCNFIRSALPGMEKRGFGRIVNFAGGGAAYSYPMFSAYGASKAALVRLTEIIADEITTPNVTINIIAPGAVATDMQVEIRARGAEARTIVDISEPVRLTVFLAGPDSGHITGRFIHSRDNYGDPALFEQKDMLKLRRVEKR